MKLGINWRVTVIYIVLFGCISQNMGAKKH
ncbi:Uncharacterised protein [Providencia rettgeri]|nr:hypothetical protein [Providencia rettgeri]CAB5553943.1 Uncharacterised protein [Providencia rettgeri]CAC9111691.1 Uncharacterised protein [Providencia rettgeri]